MASWPLVLPGQDTAASDPGLWMGLGAALGAGLLIGLERERRKGSGPHREAAGIRSFTLVSLAGALAQALQQPARHVWLFSSSEAVARLQQIAPAADWAAARALASHPRIAASARALGFGRVDAVAPSADAVIAVLSAAPR